VVLARVHREVRRHGREESALERQDAIELGETHVVTDRQSDGPALDLGDDGLVPGLLGFGLAVHLATDVDVEEVNLAIGRNQLSARIEDEARVRQLVAAFAPLGDRAADQRDPVLLRPAAHRPDRLTALDRLGGVVQHAGIADRVPLLWKGDDVCARRGRAGHEALGFLQVGGLVGAARQLDTGESDLVAHDLRIVAGPGDPGPGK
jgi:hypothetical protein